jgi:hypothetical protein
MDTPDDAINDATTRQRRVVVARSDVIERATSHHDGVNVDVAVSGRGL